MKNTVLVVDDEPSVRESLIVALEDEYRIIAVESGRQALDQILKSNIDVILLDAMMPELNGFEVLDILKADPRKSPIKVIMLTAMR